MRKCVNELGRNTDILRLRHFPRAQHVTQVVGVYVGAHPFHAEDEDYRGREENVIDEVVDNILVELREQGLVVLAKIGSKA